MLLCGIQNHSHYQSNTNLILLISSNFDIWKVVFLCLFPLFGILWTGKSIFDSLNLKTIYLTNKEPVIQKHIGKDLRMTLGTFLVSESTMVIQPVYDAHIMSMDFSMEFYSFIDADQTNIKELMLLLKSYIVDCLMKYSKE